jgi:hypothetical protein
MRAARAMPVGRSATKAARAFSSERRTACGAVVGKPEGAGASRTSGAASLVGVCVTPLWPPQRGQGIRFSCPGPVARVPAAALPVEGRRSACLAAGSTRRPRTRARARSGRHNTSPGWCPPARSQRTPLTGSAIRLRLHGVGRRTHPQPPGRDRARQRRPRASHVGCGTGLLAAHAGVELSRRWGPSASPTQQHRLLSAGGPPLPTGSGAGWHVLDADVGEPGRNHNGVPVGAARVALGMIAVRPPGRPPHSGEAGGSRQCGRSR